MSMEETKKRPGRSMMKETPEDAAVARKALENSGARLMQIVERLEGLADQLAELRGEVKETMAGAKSEGFSPAAIRQVIKRRADTPEAAKAREELGLVVDTYLAALEVAE